MKVCYLVLNLLHLQTSNSHVLSDTTPVFQVYLNNGISLITGTTYEYLVDVPASATSGLDEGNYYYDLTLYFNSSVYTIMMGILKFKKGVS